ncbi:hypothetical protein KUTeg_007629 [Tegillarca granosa]|uniref:Uncharacterized protein n=1 Tax=Tegillarca granosa TaxID=220873 RepID=A0ABQ9FDV1_TEGGR|nr:hypothetical protein KUTeg_007629 [Tegillarca granosa]
MNELICVQKMSGFYGYFKGGKAAASQPDLRDNRKNEQIQFKEKFSTSEENLEKSQPWYNRLNPMNLFSYVRKAFSQQSLQGSEEEDSDTTVCSKQVQNALIQIVKNDETCTTDANGIILFTSKEMVAKTKDFYRFPFRRKTSKLETGDFMTMKKIRAGLSKDQIYFSDDGGTKVIHAQFDIGFIPQAVDKVLEKTELLTTVEIVFQSDSIIRYSEEICKAVMEFSQKGRCKCKRTIILDVRDEEKFAILQEFIKNFDEDYGNGEHELTSEVQRVDAEHTIKLQCRASIVKTNILQEQDIQFHDNDVIKWRHICEKNMFKLKQTLEERKQCIVEKLDFSSIEVRSITQISSKNQMKKWRKEIAGFIATELTELLQLEILVYNVDQDILEEVFDDLVQFEKLKSSLSVFKDTKTRALVLCGLVNELENSDSIIHETVKRKREKQASCVFSEKMSMASYEILNNSPSITNQKMQFPELEVSYSKSREQLEIHGKHKSASRFRDILVEQLKNIYHTELNISPQQTRLLLHRQTQDFIQQKLKAHGLNSSIDIRRDPKSKFEYRTIKSSSFN